MSRPDAWRLATAVMVLSVLSRFKAEAQTAPLTLDEVLRSVDRRLPLIQAAEVERDLARTDLLSAQGAFDVAWRTRTNGTPLGYYRNGRIDSVLEQPTTLWGTTFFGGYRLGQGSFAVYDGKLETNSLGEWRAGLTVPFWRNGPIDRRRATIARAELGLGIADLAVLQQRLDLSRVAGHRYWDWVAAGQRLAAANALYDIARKRDSDLGAAVQAGEIPAIERVENARSLAQRQAQVVAAERGVQQTAIELSLYARDAEGQPALPAVDRLPGPIPDPEPLSPEQLSSDQATALEQRPEVRRVTLQQSQAEIELDWARNQLAPGLDFTLAASQDTGAGSHTRQPMDLEAALMIDVPLQTRVASGRVANAESTLARLAAQARFAGDRIRADVQDSHSALSAAVQRVAIARQELGLARQVAEAERTKFFLGDSTLFMVNLRELAAFDAAIREVDALQDYRKAQVSYWVAIGIDAAAAARQPAP
jgi:cobalt-zinc-cadmium efflux system outer membrane protein